MRWDCDRTRVTDCAVGEEGDTYIYVDMYTYAYVCIYMYMNIQIYIYVTGIGLLPAPCARMCENGAIYIYVYIFIYIYSRLYLR